ncbi:flagellar assembly protein FliH [Virgibacillus ainsalahensis]
MSREQHLQNKIIKIKPIELPVETSRNRQEQEEIIEIQNELQNSQEQLLSIQHQKEKLVNEMENEKKQWGRKKQQLMEEAKQEGYRAGFSEGREESLAKYKKLLDKANSITNEAIKDYHSTIDKSEEAILDLSVNAAEKIMKQQMTNVPESFLSIVKAAIETVKDQSVISINLNPANYEHVLKQKDELVRILEGETKLAIYVTEEISENGCLIRHPFGEIDASIDTQLQQIRAVLHEIAMENKE